MVTEDKVLTEQKALVEVKRASEEMYLDAEQKEYFDQNPDMVALIKEVAENGDVPSLSLNAAWRQENISRAVVAQFSRALMSNNTVKNISLHVQRGVGLKEFSEYLKQTKTLETLTLDFDHAHEVPETYAELKEALEANRSLKKIRICNFMVNDKFHRNRGSGWWGSTGGEIFIPSLAGLCVMCITWPIPRVVQDAVHSGFNKVRPSSWKKVAADRLLLAIRGIINNNKNIESIELVDSDGGRMDYRELRRRVSRRFFHTLKSNTNLKTLVLNGMSLSKHSIRHLGRYLGKNRGLETIEIANDRTASYHGYGKFIKGLRKNQGLKSLTIRDSGIGDDDLPLFLNALSNKTNLTELSFFRSHIGDEGAFKLAEWIEKETGPNAKKPHLKTLRLTNYLYMLTMTGIRRLANIVRVSDSITTLALGEGTLRDEHPDEYVKEMSELLSSHRTLTDVTLYGPGISEKCLPAITEALQKNQTITRLDLSNCPFASSQMTDTFVKALENINFSLSECELGHWDRSGEYPRHMYVQNHAKLDAMTHRNAMLPLPITLASYMKDIRSSVCTFFPQEITDIIADYSDVAVTSHPDTGLRKEDIKLQKELISWVYRQKKPISWEQDRAEIIDVARELAQKGRLAPKERGDRDDHKDRDDEKESVFERIGDFLGVMLG